LMMLLLAVLAVPVLVLAFQVLVSSRNRPAAELAARQPHERLAVLIPAHNEAAGIARTLDALKPQLAGRDRLLVVADNCQDETAAIARACGAEAIERFNATERGKGYALAFGLEHLKADPVQQVIIVDADCQVADGAIHALWLACARTNRPQQALYLMHPPEGSNVGRLVAAFAWRIKNWARPSGMARLGLPCQLMGTGMAFRFEQLTRIKLASGNIVEDMQMGLDLAKLGAAPQFCPEALVTSEFPASDAAAATQRTRWEHGHLQTIRSAGLPLLLQGLKNRNKDQAALALDLMVPPVVLLTLLIVASSVIGIGFFSGWVAGLALFNLAALCLALGLGWLRFGQDLLPLREVWRTVPYVLGKVGLYRKALTNAQKSWVRTERDKK
jgi:cellulose synthase/poly-beta-1,6-N-acetylglucosamine synthase-like glycosyltransferase